MILGHRLRHIPLTIKSLSNFSVIDQTNTTTNSTNSISASLSWGTEHSNRMLLIFFVWQMTGAYAGPPSITVGGTSATILNYCNETLGTTNNSGALVAGVYKPTGTGGTITATFTGYTIDYANVAVCSVQSSTKSLTVLEDDTFECNTASSPQLYVWTPAVTSDEIEVVSYSTETLSTVVETNLTNYYYGNYYGGFGYTTGSPCRLSFSGTTVRVRLARVRLGA